VISRDRITFRPESPADDPLLLMLYATTRERELSLVPWSDEEKLKFVVMQFEAQRSHYRLYYAKCEFLVIELDGNPIGRLYVDRQEADIRLIDIILLPQLRGSGIGTALVQELLDEAAGSSRAVTIHVESYNPALHLYQRLGFRHVDTNGVYNLMEWKPDQVNTAS
jgi:ribosomal protein S18 acetylase RimI-like enzyme